MYDENNEIDLGGKDILGSFKSDKTTHQALLYAQYIEHFIKIQISVGYKISHLPLAKKQAIDGIFIKSSYTNLKYYHYGEYTLYWCLYKTEHQYWKRYHKRREVERVSL